MDKQKAIDQFVRRCRYAKTIQKVDKCGMHAGSPIYVYCDVCGVPLECLPEDPVFDSFKKCSQCLGLESNNWLNEAKNHSDELH